METVKRTSIALGKVDLKYIEQLRKLLGISTSAVIKRAVEFYYYETNKKEMGIKK